jgi:hypothetical protein
MASPITFGEWRPDAPTHMSPALVQADNVLSIAGSPAPFPAHVPIAGTALPLPAKGFFPALLSDGTPMIYGATRDSVYLIRNGSFRIVYTTYPARVKRWWFAQVGGKVCAGCDAVPPVGAELGKDMVALGGNPPTAAVGAVVNRDYLVLGNLKNEEADGTVENRVRWSGVMNPDTWGTDIATGADFEDMHDEGGPVMAITGRSVGLVFQRKAITRMQFTGNPSTVFAFTVLELGRGVPCAGAVCDAGPIVCYYSDDGFFAHDGSQSIPIGDTKVNDWFAKNADPAKFDLMRSGYDPAHRCVLWAFTEVGQSVNSAILCYSIPEARFTLIRLGMQDIASAATLPASIESMPTPDTDPLSWDDASRVGKQPVLAGIDQTNTYGSFTGATLAATITTGDFQANPGSRAFVSGVRPIVDASGVQVAVGTKSQLTSDPVVWRPASAQGADGTCPQRADARYHRFKMTTPAGANWSRAVGLELDLQEAGER